MSLAETMANSFLKSLDIGKLLATPQVSEVLTALRTIVADFAAIKENQAIMRAQLDSIQAEMRLSKSPPSGFVFPALPVAPSAPAHFDGAMSNE